MFDSETVRNVLSTVAAAGILAGGGMALNVRNKVDLHGEKLTAIEKTQDRSIAAMNTELHEISEGVDLARNDLAEVKRDVAVLKERTEHYEAQRNGPRARP